MTLSFCSSSTTLPIRPSHLYAHHGNTKQLTSYSSVCCPVFLTAVYSSRSSYNPGQLSIVLYSVQHRPQNPKNPHNTHNSCISSAVDLDRSSPHRPRIGTLTAQHAIACHDEQVRGREALDHSTATSRSAVYPTPQSAPPSPALSS